MKVEMVKVDRLLSQVFKMKLGDRYKVVSDLADIKNSRFGHEVETKIKSRTGCPLTVIVYKHECVVV